MKQVFANQELYNNQNNILNVVQFIEPISQEARKEFETTLTILPKRLIDGINQIEIKNAPNLSSGEYEPRPKTIKMTIAKGFSAVLIHEIHHFIWHNKRTVEELNQWRNGVKKIMLEYKQSPSRHSDSYCEESMDMIQSAEKKLKLFREKLENGIITLNMVFPHIEDLKNDISWYEQHMEDINKFNNEDYNDKCKRLGDTLKYFVGLSQAEKIQQAQTGFKMLKTSINNIKFNDIFYNECHSEVGSFIYTEKSMRERAIGNQRINETVMGKYVELYKRVFNS